MLNKLVRLFVYSFISLLVYYQQAYAQGVSDVVGTVQNPLIGPYGTAAGGGLIAFFSNLLRLVFAGAGIFALVNFITAGYQYMSAGGDSKALGAAWARIWQTLWGLVLLVGSFAMAALFGYLIFGNPMFILNPKVYGPGN